MEMVRKIFFILAIVLSAGAYTSYAQEIYVTARPARPRYERIAAPSPRHVWIDEDWEPRGGAYVFVGGHWAEPPHLGMVWVPGRWRHSPRGYIWVRGHWR